MKSKIILFCIFFLVLPLNYSCVALTVKGDPAYIEGNAPADIGISLFNGRATKNIRSSNGRFRTAHTATAGLYEVVFFTKDKYLPKAVVLKAGEDAGTIRLSSLQKLKDGKKGVVTGVVYKPESGGKLESREGILGFFEGGIIKLTGAGVSYSTSAGRSGVFTIEVPEGEYDIALGSKRIGKVSVAQGKTTIKSIGKGKVLID